MKKSTIVLLTALLIFSCSKPTNNPTPIIPTPTAVVVAPLTKTNTDFIGKWNCYIWVVDEISGTTRRRELLFSERINSTTSLNFSVNAYKSDSTFNQLITGSTALIDSNYFDNPINPAAVKFKGYLLTDSTMNVYQYTVGASGVIDTNQVQIFKKAK